MIEEQHVDRDLSALIENYLWAILDELDFVLSYISRVRLSRNIMIYPRNFYYLLLNP